MKLVISAVAAVLLAGPLAAQTASAPMPAPSSTPATGTKYTLDTIAADPAGKAVLDKDIPGMTAHPLYDTFKAMTLNALQPASQGQITEAQVAAVKADLAAIK